MKYLSLFTGIGGFELGINKAHATTRNTNVQAFGGRQTTTQGELQENGEGLHAFSTETAVLTRDRDNEHPDWSFNEGQPTCIGFSEIDKYATQIYQSHFPTHHNYGDITKINADELPDFDLLVGGFPCQAFSIAGKRKGFDDTRGTLFFEIARILKAKQPRLFLLENVKGLLSHDNGATFSTIISTLDELGYDLQWQVLNSKNHGVPQNRERVFIVGHLRGTSRPEVFPFGEGDGRNTEPQAEARGEGERIRSNIASTLAARDYKGGGNLIQLNNPTHSNDRVYGTGGVSPTLNTMQGGNRQPFVLAERGRYNDEGKTEQRMEPRYDGVSNTLTSVEKDNRLFDGMKIRRLTPVECERLQGFPDNWTAGVSDTQRYKCCGNAVTVNVIADIMERLLK
jgi:DNA (cytosine-5)-methyltransferase 1